MEKRWLTKDEEKKVRGEIKWNIPSLVIPCALIIGILGVGLYFDPKKSGIAAIFFLPVAGILFRLVFREFRDLRRITEKRYVIKEFEIVDTGSGYALGKMQKYVTLREVNSDVEENVNTSGSYYVFAENNFVYGIEIEGRKKRIYFGGRKA